MIDKLGFEKWDTPFVADSNTAFIRGQRAKVGVYDDCFEDGMDCERSGYAYEVDTILGTRFEELDGPYYDDCY